MALSRFPFVVSLMLLLGWPLEQLTFGMADCVHLGGCAYEASPVRSSSCSAAA